MSAPWVDDTPKPGRRLKLEPTPTSDEEEAAYFLTPEERESHRLMNAKLDLENKQFERDMTNREGFAEKAYSVTAGWLGFLVILTLAQFVIAKNWQAGLTEKEFIVVITTTTASVFGFWLLVGQYLFHRPAVAAAKNKMPKLRKRAPKRGAATAE